MLNILICCMLSFFALQAQETSSFIYLKGAAAITPAYNQALPSIGIGMRYKKNDHGFDASATISSLVFLNYFSLKGFFLFYPFEVKRLYFGCGPGLGYHLNSGSIYHHAKGSSHESSSLNLEAVIGYEFSQAAFIQLELTQPIVYLKNQSKYLSGAALSFGVGY